MPTKNQLLNYKFIKRLPKYRRNKVQYLKKCPQKKGTVFKLMLITPRKPNSAIRKVARLRLAYGKLIFAYIPGEGHSLAKFSVVLIRGGRAQDLPGVYYKLIRGKFDFSPIYTRIKQRSKQGLKKIQTQGYQLK